MDIFTKEHRSQVMRAIRSKNTRPELAIRSALHRSGFRFRLHRKELPGNPDIVLGGRRIALQIRGCYWHGHTCSDGHIPKSNKGYWALKLSKNKERDKRNDRKLRRLGWRVMVVWECSCEARKLEKTVCRIVKWIDRRD